jgi:hypothetical protein
LSEQWCLLFDVYNYEVVRFLKKFLSIHFIFVDMRSMVITPKNQDEFRFISNLLEKLGIAKATMTDEEMEDMGLSKLLKEVDKTKKATKKTILRKLTS